MLSGPVHRGGQESCSPRPWEVGGRCRAGKEEFFAVFGKQRREGREMARSEEDFQKCTGTILGPLGVPGELVVWLEVNN